MLLKEWISSMQEEISYPMPINNALFSSNFANIIIGNKLQIGEFEGKRISIHSTQRHKFARNENLPSK